MSASATIARQPATPAEPPANYTDVTVTPHDHLEHMEMAFISPATRDTLSELLSAAVAQHADLGRVPTVDELIDALADVLADSRWRSYRAGRVRVAGLCGAYWQWLAPPLDVYRPAGEPLTWTDGQVVFADVLLVDECFTADRNARRIADVQQAGIARHGERFAGVRALQLDAPCRSKLVVGRRATPLVDTPLWFGGTS